MLYQNYAKTVILGNGNFPCHSIPLKILRHAKTIICCDGAADELLIQGIIPTVIIGDMDSISEENRIKYEDRIVRIADQDTNDQTKAIEWAIGNGIKEIVILGSTGKREDHTIGNISLLCQYAKKIKVCSITDTGMFLPVIKSTEFESFKGQQISIFSLNPLTKISSENLKYPLHELCLSSWWMGTLNESTSQKFSLHFTDGELIVFQKFAD